MHGQRRRADLLDQAQQGLLVLLVLLGARAHAASLGEEDIPAGLDKDRVPGVGVPTSHPKDPGDQDGRTDAGAAGLEPRIAEGPDQGDDPFDLRQRQSGAFWVIAASVAWSNPFTRIVTIRSRRASWAPWTPAYSAGLLVKMIRKSG